MPQDFSRDLGYLDKFLHGLRAHAATLGEPAGSRLAALMDEQDRAWTEIKGILAGGSGSGSANPGSQNSASAGSSERAAAAPEAEASESPRAEAAPKRLTVGSLMS